MIVETLVVGPLQANCYILSCEETRSTAVIDPGGDPERIADRLRSQQLNLEVIIGTHAHLDHVLGVRDLAELTGAPFWLHPLEEPLLAQLASWTRLWLGFDPGPPPVVDGYLKEGEPLHVGRTVLEVRLTPGHSPGSVCLVDHATRQAFVGDLVFQGSVGRSDLPGGDHATLIRSVVNELFSLGDDFVLHAGHGPATTVGSERRHNPFFRGHSTGESL